MKHSVIMILKVHDHFNKNGSIKSNIATAINQKLLSDSLGCCYAAEDDEVLLVVGFETVPSFLYLQNLLHELSNRVLLLIRNEFGLKASIGVSNHCSSLSQIQGFYRQAQAAIAGIFYLGKNRIIHYTEVSDYTNKPIKDFKEYEELILQSLTDSKRVTKMISELYKEMFERRVSLEEVKSFNFEFVSFIKKQQRDNDIAEQELFGSGQSPYEVVNQLETMEEVVNYLNAVMLRMNELLLTRSKGKYRPEVANAINYMRDNYNGNISLEIVASQVNMNSAYFSNLFKRETDENFVAFLQKIRMEKAKVLLKTTHDKVYDIASQVGVDNYQYFCNIFKQYTGMTPIQYRGQSNRIDL